MCVFWGVGGGGGSCSPDRISIESGPMFCGRFMQVKEPMMEASSVN